jgi:hypothetical protein
VAVLATDQMMNPLMRDLDLPRRGVHIDFRRDVVEMGFARLSGQIRFMNYPLSRSPRRSTLCCEIGSTDYVIVHRLRRGPASIVVLLVDQS